MWPFLRARRSGSIRLSRILARRTSRGLDPTNRFDMVLSVSALVGGTRCAHRRTAPRPSELQGRNQSTGTDLARSHIEHYEGNSKKSDLSAQPGARKIHLRSLATVDVGKCRHQDDISGLGR